MTEQAVTTGRILDLLAETAARAKRETLDAAVSWTMLHMTDRERVAFDLFLVKTGDELPYRAGAAESRLRERVRRMIGYQREGETE